MTTKSPFSSRIAWFMRGTVLAAAPVLLTACGQSAQQATPTGEPSGAATGQTDEAAMAGSVPAAPVSAQTAPVVDESAAAPLADVVPVPVAAQADPAAAAPLQDAATITTEISRGSGIERIRHGDGWAWMRNDKIIRTASDDGKKVAYFRNGSDTPFLVQDHKHAYAYAGGKVTHSYDNGHARAIDNGDRKDAAKLIARARNDRNDAAHVAATNPPRHTTRPTPTPSQSSTGRKPSHQRPGTPTPSPAPSHTSDRGTSTMRGASGSSAMRPSRNSDSMRSSHGADSMRSARPTPTPTPT
jgi:hypothetical protein